MNNAKLTYLFILSAVACLLSSCTSDAPDSDFGKKAEISFAVSDRTRAVTTDITEFAVYGDMKLAANNTATPTVIFNKTKVEYTGTRWYYPNVQYWFPQHEHSFVAVSPSLVLEADPDIQYLNSKLSFSYGFPTSANGAFLNPDIVPDIVVATHRRLYNPTDINLSTVFGFSHIMSLVNFAPALDDNGMDKDDYILFHKMELSGVNTKARFDILPAPRLSGNQTDDMMVDVTGQETGNLAIWFKTPVMVKNDVTNVSLFADNDALIMLPQTFEVNSESEIILYYTKNNETAMNQVNIPLKGMKWESGKSHIYRFTIERTCVKFGNCEINPWNLIPGDKITVD